MRRKIVKQGSSTMMVSLPSKWIKKNKLKKGDEIEIEEKQDSLIISVKGPKIKRESEINITSLTETSIRTLITNTYRLGYDRIKINFRDKRAVEIIKQSIEKDLIGFEVIKISDNYVEVENITEPSKEQFDSIFHKIFMNIDELFNIAENMLDGKEEDFEHVEEKIKKFDNFCRRIISKHSLYENPQLMWAFNTKLIHAQRELYLMLRYIKKNNIKGGREAFEFLGQCKEIFNMLEQGCLKKDISLLEKVHDIEKDLIYKKGYEVLKKNKDNVIMHHLISSARNFYLASSPLIGHFICQEA